MIFTFNLSSAPLLYAFTHTSSDLQNFVSIIIKLFVLWLDSAMDLSLLFVR